jgi:predicted permease
MRIAFARRETVNNLLKDIQFGLRVLMQKPGFTAIAILTLALGIGANTAIFTLFDAVLLESLPVHEPARLVLFSDNSGEGTQTSDPPPSGHWNYFSSESYDFLRAQPLPFQSIAAVRSGEDPVSVRFAGASGDAQVQRATAHLVSGNYFDTLGVSAVMGRTLEPSDDQPNAQPATVISDGYWKARLASDPSIVGKNAILNGTSFTIVGVTPPEFFGERVRRPPDYWVPLTFQPQIELRPSFITQTNAYWLNLFGRLKPGVTREQAAAAGTVSLRQFLTNKAGDKLTDDRKREIGTSYIGLQSGAGGVSGLRFLYSQPLHILLYVVALVLLIACANVGNLLLSRAAARRTEISVRLAMGASRGRLIRQLLTESLLLAILGAACGILLALWAVHGLMLLVAKTSPMQPHLNLPVLGFTVGVTLIAGLLFGLAPALYAGRTDLVTALKAGGRSVAGQQKKFGASQVLVIAQIALSLVLIMGANLLARSLLNLEHVSLGFDQDHVILARINPRLAGYKPTNVSAYYRKLYDQLNALPGIRGASLDTYSPYSGSTSISTTEVQGYTPKEHEDMGSETVFVGPDYPNAMGMTLVQGRAIGLQDGPGAPLVAMVNEAFARKYFGNSSAIGHRCGFDEGKHGSEYEIVGVLKDPRFHDPTDSAEIFPMVMPALLQDASQFALSGEVVVRTPGDPSAAAPLIRQAIGQADSSVPVSDLKSLREQIDSQFTEQRLAARLVSFFGGLALLLACVGLYGIVSQGISRRTNEFGVRIAMGAQRGDILQMVLRETLILLAVGLVIGIPAALGATKFVASQLFAVSARDPFSLVLGIVILGAVRVTAGFIPARRASRVDPIIALRYE